MEVVAIVMNTQTHIIYRELLATIKFGIIVKIKFGEVKFNKFRTCLVTTPTLMK